MLGTLSICFRRTTLSGLVVLLMLSSSGCMNEEEGSTLDGNGQSTDGTIEVPEKLIFRSSNYSVSQQDYLNPEQDDNLALEAISKKIMQASWEDKDLRPKFVLVRINQNGKSDLICVKRNESEEGQLIVELNTFVDEEYFEAESEVDSPTTMVRLVEAFFNREPAIKNMIKWDQVVD